jgi:nucleotide-binding universal stress UspA family protein
MLPFTRILFPVDYSDHAAGAARYVEAFAGRFDAQVVMLHSVDLPHYNDALADISPARKREQLDAFLEKEFEYFRVERVILRGDPARNILKTATEKHCDLIMMPTHGLGGFRRFLLGSVTAKVLHDADAPVFTGAHLEQAPALENIEFRTFVCAVSSETYGRKVLAAAAEFANVYRGKLVVVHATGGLENAASSRREIEQAVAAAGADAEIVIERGEVPNIVAAEVVRHNADLLIIGRSPAPGVFGRLRAHAYPIIRQSPCPVISV